MTILVTFATYREAQVSLDELEAKQVNEELFSFDRGCLLITGMGMLNAAIKVAHYQHLADEIWNFGAVGALKDHPLFSLLPISSIEKWHPFPSDTSEYSKSFANKVFPSITLQEEGYKLLSTDFPLHQESLKRELASNYDCIDMEGYGLVQTNKKVRMWKCISDFASQNGEKLISQHLDEISKRLADELIKQLSLFEPGARVRARARLS